MTNYETVILRQVGWRDHNFKPLASNDPAISTIGWTLQFGGTATSNGDVLTVTAAAEPDVKRSVSGSLSTNKYPYVVVRVNTGTYVGNNVVQVNYADTTSDQFLLTTKTNTWQTAYFKMTSGKTIASLELIMNGNAGNTGYWDYVAICGQTPLIVSNTDLYRQIITDMGSNGISHAELELRNGGTFLPGGTKALNFGDHIHCYLPSSSNPTGGLFHTYGGIIESIQPSSPPDIVTVHSRSFGISLLETLILANFQNLTFRQLFNSFLDSYVNAVTKDTVAIATPYQLTRSFVQDIGFPNQVGLYTANLIRARDAMIDIADLSISQGWPFNNPAVFFVDPAENLHLVPLGAQGIANWGTGEPFYTANYPVALSVGSWQITNNFVQDIKSLANRVHYYGIAQIPGVVDAWTDFSTDGGVQGQWDSENGAAGQSVTYTHDTSRVAQGSFSVHAKLNADSATTNSQWRFFTPKAKNLGLDISSMGSPNSPPLFDFYWRMTHTGDAGNVNPTYIFFATDSTHLTRYKFIDQGAGIGGIASTTIMNLTSDLVTDQWYHLLLPVGPNAGTLFANPPTLNGIATASFTGASNFQISNPGNPVDWTNVNYVGYQTDFNPSSNGQHQDFYFDGWRFLGGRYILAKDNRTAGPPFDLSHSYSERREIHFFDPIAKDETALRNFARAELLRLRNPITRGSFATPIMGDILAEQQVQAKIPSAGYPSLTYFRIIQAVHTISGNGMITELTVSDDFVNAQTLSPFKMTNALLQMGENAILNRQVYDLKTFIADPATTPLVLSVS